MKFYGLPQPLNGDEAVTIHQLQNGEWAKCTMPLSMLIQLVIDSFLKNLPTEEPTTAGVAWNNAGVISIS
ncbi:hypothetical protein DM81_3486 [Burkholderia multivorans]|uniref:hypothetical protein n=1 Tax=Burkholderia multivorans TaxID=87883 RepID=UPI0005100DCA|nr:hypothetical protein [Burkholderia multivorans]KGC03598.1 hypothetical protein DM81_3486 [Burkholderia multivorans]